MDDQQDFRELMGQVQAGSEEAARRLYDEYGSHILRIVRHRMPEQLRSKFDSIDFVQDVWTSFFTDPPQDQQFDNPKALVGYLMRLAKRKVTAAYRKRLGSLKHDVRRERAMRVEGEAAAEVEAGFGADAVGDPFTDPRQHTPSHWVMADERWQRLLDGQTPARRHALLMLREGSSQREVAERLGLSQKAIQRLLRRLLPEGEQ
jgi:RNA polymerase sigma factor (sigma-70 family)